MRTFLYIDGFNLYYSAVKNTPLRWLNPLLLAETAFPKNQIVHTRYFSAKVTDHAVNPGQVARQLLSRLRRTIQF